jgi:hypothetical protein
MATVFSSNIIATPLKWRTTLTYGFLLASILLREHDQASTLMTRFAVGSSQSDASVTSNMVRLSN